MIDHNRIKIGSLWISDDKPNLVVISKERSGHQYDRHYLCDCSSTEGKIVQIEDYELLRLYQEVKDD